MVKDIEVKNTLMKTKFNNIHFGFASQTSKEVVLRVFCTNATLPLVKSA